jgi:hypothetical protein
MTAVYKILGQVNPAASTLTTAYTAISGVVVSTISVCNLGVNTNYRIALRQAGAAIDPKQYLVYNTSIESNDSVYLTLGITMAATDVLSVYAGTANVSFNIFGSEIT